MSIGDVHPAGMRRASRCAAAVILATLGSAGLAAPALGAQVGVTDNAYLSPATTIASGETVTWTFTAGFDHHNVHFEDESFIAPREPSPASWTAERTTFPAPGAYRYYCDEHGGPGAVGMFGVVYVDTPVPGTAPTAAFTAPDEVTTGQIVTFDGSATSDPDGDVRRYEWDLEGDGQFEIDSATNPVTSGMYSTAGTRTAALRVTDLAGHTSVTTRTVTVSGTPPAPTPTPTPPAADVIAPVLSSLSMDPSAFKAGRGTSVTYRLSEAATTTFAVHRIAKGRRKGRACRPPRSSNRRGARCVRYVKVRGSFRHAGTADGVNTVRFTGKLRGRRLAAGRYRLTAVARDEAGNVATAQTTTFRIRGARGR